MNDFSEVLAAMGLTPRETTVVNDTPPPFLPHSGVCIFPGRITVPAGIIVTVEQPHGGPTKSERYPSAMEFRPGDTIRFAIDPEWTETFAVEYDAKKAKADAEKGPPKVEASVEAINLAHQMCEAADGKPCGCKERGHPQGYPACKNMLNVARFILTRDPSAK